MYLLRIILILFYNHCLSLLSIDLLLFLMIVILYYFIHHITIILLNYMILITLFEFKMFIY